MLTCIDRDTMQCVSAEKCWNVSKKGFICNDCHTPVSLVLDKVFPAIDKDAKQTPRFFRHVIENASCGYSLRNPTNDMVLSSVVMMPCKTGNVKWMKQWQNLSPTKAKSHHDHAIEIQDVLGNQCDPNKAPIQIFDATHAELFEYTDFMYQKNKLFMCIDTGFDTSDGAIVLVHCNDGRLLQSRCLSPVRVLCDEREITVRFLTRLDEDIICRLDNFFQQEKWPPRVLSVLKMIKIQRPLQVLSVEGRHFIDQIHRQAFTIFPGTGSVKVIDAVPGAGKSTAIKQVVRLWRKKRILIVVFNKSNQMVLQQEIKRMGRKCTVRTLDSLCGAVMPCKFEVNYGEGMDIEQGERYKLECNEMDNCCLEEKDPTLDSDDDDNPMGKDDHNDASDEEEEVDEENVEEEESDVEFDPVFSDNSFVKAHFKKWDLKEKMKYAGGVGSAAMIRNRLLHPRAVPTICKFHKRLTLTHMSCKSQAWNAKTTTFPINKIVDAKSTFAARRFICDRDSLLVKNFQKYDVVICDEYQVNICTILRCIELHSNDTIQKN